jgi:large subunit ribosomal protein L9
MKVILNENVDNVGKLGDIVDVKAGFARNYLLPRRLVLEPTKHNVELLKFKKIKAAKKLELEKLSAAELKKKLEEITLTIKKKAGETDTLFGSVTAMEIESKLAEAGISIERKKFHLEEPIKKLGNYVCKIRLVEDMEADLKIEVTRDSDSEGEEADKDNDNSEK